IEDGDGDGESDRQGREPDAGSDPPGLPRQSTDDDWGEATSDGLQGRRDRSARLLESEAHEPERQKSHSQPEEKGRQKGDVVHRHGRDALWSEHDLISGLRRSPKDERGEYNQDDVEITARPRRILLVGHESAGRSHGKSAGVEPRGNQNRP